MRWMPILFAVVTLGLAANPAGAAADAIFDGGVAIADDLAHFPHWRRLVQKLRASGDDQRLSPAQIAGAAPPVSSELPPSACDDDCGRRRWTGFLRRVHGKPWLEQLQAVNRWANAKPYIADWINWGVADYWETPEEFVRQGGDCEDYAIAKYFSLLRLGFAPSDLRIVVVHDRNLNASHALLAVRHEGRSWLLDIVVNEVLPLARVPQYTPVYALDLNASWLYPPVPSARETVDPTDRR